MDMVATLIRTKKVVLPQELVTSSSSQWHVWSFMPFIKLALTMDKLLETDSIALLEVIILVELLEGEAGLLEGPTIDPVVLGMEATMMPLVEVPDVGALEAVEDFGREWPPAA